MKILSYEIQNGMMRIETDYEERPVFVYKAGRFKTHQDLVDEIEKSISLEQKRKEKHRKNIDSIKDEFERRGIKEKCRKQT
jgi:hypothetical protein